MIHRPFSGRRGRLHPVARLALGLVVLLLGGGVLLGLGVLAATPAAVGELANAPAPGAVSLPSQSSALIETNAPPSPSPVGASAVGPTSLEASAGNPIPLPGTRTGPATSSSAPSSPILDPPPGSGPFAMDLYRKGQFVTELIKVMCVPAATQTMINIMTGATDRSAATQDHLYSLARKLSPKTLKGPGAEPEGWAAALAKLGYGSYVVSIKPTFTAAVQAAAKAVRMTARPAGLLVWYGAHAWVMSGFRATADPAWTNRFTVTDLYIEDVWYPKMSTIWGRSRPPDALVPIQRLTHDFLPWRMPGGPYPDKLWKFVLVLPMPTPGA